MARLALAALLVASLKIGAAMAAKVDCEPARCAVQAAINAQCDCGSSTNHGQYVSCVAHVVKQLSVDGTVPIECKGKVTRCAAKSVCGKDGFVTCQVPTSTCVIPAGALTGTCENDPTIVCTNDLACGAKCRIKSSADRCTAASGVVGTSPTCCPSCAE